MFKIKLTAKERSDTPWEEMGLNSAMSPDITPTAVIKLDGLSAPS